MGSLNKLSFYVKSLFLNSNFFKRSNSTNSHRLDQLMKKNKKKHLMQNLLGVNLNENN